MFKPPAGFHALTRDPVVARTMQRGNRTFVAEYRRTVHEPYDNGKVLLSESVVITISTGDGFGLDPHDYAQTMLASMQKAAKLRNVAMKPVPLCGGRTGWLLAYESPAPSSERYRELFAQSGTLLYITRVSYPQPTGDFGAIHALSTLCPPALQAAAQTGSSGETLPFTLPAGWNRTSDMTGSFAPPLVPIARWLRLSTHSLFLESLLLVKGPPLQDGATAQEQSLGMLSWLQTNAPGFSLKSSHAQSYCGTDGWLASYTQGQGRNVFAVTTAYAYGANDSYYLTYSRKIGDPENEGAVRALDSLCAPLPPSSAPEPASSATPR